MFNITQNIEENKTFIEYNGIIDVLVKIYEYDAYDNFILLYQSVSNFNNNTFWFSTGKKLMYMHGVKIEIIQNDNLIESKIILHENKLLNNEHNINNKFENYISKKISKNVSIYIDIELGLGDFMWVTPFIRKLYNIYNKKIDIYGYFYYKEFLKNNPYVNNFYIKDNFSLNEINDNNENFIVYNDIGVPYLYSDLRQLSAKSANITLKDDELELDYIPDDFIDIPELPNNYVLINPRIDHIERRFNNNNDWQILVDLLNDRNIPVVAIGVGPSKHYTDINIRNGVNLIYDDRQSNLSQTWHIINNSDVFITFDTGMYVFAGTTDTNILLNGWNCDPWFHQPIRKNDRNYKFATVRGYCPFYCTTDPRSNIVEHDTTKLLHVTNRCVLNINYNCKPTPKMIVDKLDSLKWI